MKPKLPALLLSLLCGLHGCDTPSSRLSFEQKIPGPYPSLSGSFSGEAVAQSPDPLVAYRWADPKASDDLESYVLYPESVGTNNPAHARWKPKRPETVEVSGPCELMFDFGRVSAGWLEFDAEGLDGAEIEMSISEFNEPAVFNAGSEHPRKTAVPVRYGDTYRLELNRDLYEGVRFGWIHVRRIGRPVTLSDVRLVCQIKPTNYEGSFACSDTMLTRIWYTGAYDVKLNLLKDYFGAILMERSDRHSWTGDAHPSQAASMVAFGNFDFVRTNLFYTSTQFNGIAAYSLYWVLSLIDYYDYTADRATLDSLTENACGKLDAAYAHYENAPSLQFYGWDERLGAGFEHPDGEETRTAYKMLSIRAWREFARTMTHAGRTDLARKYQGYADEKIEALRQTGTWTSALGIHAAADAVNAGFADPAERAALWETAFSDRLQRLSYSPFNQYFIMQAVARMGRYDEALATADDCWGGQIRYGGTTFFEVYRPCWNDVIVRNGAPVNNQCGYTSLTHPWSAGIVKWLSEEILGIKPLAPGFAQFSVTPCLSATLTWVEGSVPTPHGTIRASFDLERNRAEITVPEETSARIGLPKAGRKVGSVTVDGQPVAPLGEDSAFVYIALERPGRHLIETSSTGTLAEPVREPLRYAYETIPAQDSTTGGNWRGIYGNRGHILCNYDGDGRHRTQLPDFITSVVFAKNGDRCLHTGTADTRAPESDRPDETVRNIGTAFTLDPAPCNQTMTIDIESRDATPYRIALYFIDWERDERRSAVEVFDLKNKELLMPVQIVDRYGEGKYVIVEADRSVRLRIDQIRGTNASLGALFFD